MEHMQHNPNAAGNLIIDMSPNGPISYSHDNSPASAMPFAENGTVRRIPRPTEQTPTVEATAHQPLQETHMPERNLSDTVDIAGIPVNTHRLWLSFKEAAAARAAARKAQAAAPTSEASTQAPVPTRQSDSWDRFVNALNALSRPTPPSTTKSR